MRAVKVVWYMRRLMTTISTMNSSDMAPMARCMSRPSASSRTESGVSVNTIKTRPIFQRAEKLTTAPAVMPASTKIVNI